MKTIFRYRLIRLRGQILGWGISLALLAVVLVLFYGTIAEESEQWKDLLENYPKEMMAFFGDFGDLDNFATPSVYMGIKSSRPLSSSPASRPLPIKTAKMPSTRGM